MCRFFLRADTHFRIDQPLLKLTTKSQVYLVDPYSYWYTTSVLLITLLRSVFMPVSMTASKAQARLVEIMIASDAYRNRFDLGRY